MLAHGRTVHAIVGTQRPERLAELQGALELALDRGQLAWLTDGPAEASVIAQ